MDESVQLHAPAVLPSGKNCSTHWIEGWACPRADLDMVYISLNTNDIKDFSRIIVVHLNATCILFHVPFLSHAKSCFEKIHDCQFKFLVKRR